jgi:methionyl-tRNA synthetase
MLMEQGDFVLADNVPANEFLNLEGDKISTSRNWAVWLHEYLIDFKNQQDVLRYTLCSNAPESKDNDFTWKDFQLKNNSELVAIFGNFVNRTLVLTHKFYDGVVPNAETYTKEDLLVLEELAHAPDKISKAIEQFKFREAVNEWMNVARIGNKYLADTEPWKLVKSDENRVKTIMNIALQISNNLAILAEPFLPFTSKKLFELLNKHPQNWPLSKQTNNVAAGHKINKDELLFAKVEDADVQKQLDKLEQSKQLNLANNTSIKEIKPETTFDDFSKMDIRTATILEAERVPKTEKLLKLKVDTGVDVRTIVSGIAQFYDPEKIIGQKVCMLANLAPRKIKGIESKGMILMAENKSGELCFVSPSNINFNDGSEVK